MMLEKLILNTLQKAITAQLVALGKPDFPVKYEGITFVPPNDQRYVELIYIPNNPNDLYWNAEKVYRGVFRVILHWPIDNVGAYAPMQFLSDVCEPFRKDAFFGALKITDHPNFLGSVANGADVLYSASIRYLLFDGG
jgi:hypothetical protein